MYSARDRTVSNGDFSLVQHFGSVQNDDVKMASKENPPF